MSESNVPVVDPPAVLFYNVRGKVAVNIIPLSDLTFLPRIGETVWLPGTTKGAGYYRVTGLTHYNFRPKRSPRTLGLIEYYKRESGVPPSEPEVPAEDHDLVIGSVSSRIHVDVELVG